MTNPKVLVGCPTSIHKKYCIEEYLAAAKALTYPNYDLILVDNTESDEYYDFLESKGVTVFKAPYYAETARERIVVSRNMLRQYALENDYDYFLSLEQDVIPPLDIIEQLLKQEKKVIAGVYFMEYTVKKEGQEMGKKILPLLYRRQDQDTFVQLTERDVALETVLLIDMTGLGCILIHRDVLEKIEFRFEEDKILFDDWFFCQDLKKESIPLFVDTKVKCKHLMREMDWDNIKK
ncbi:MAG TPA: hypothetical protein VJH37_01460 [Candidatus Nanoarchaeia archaeon]|nr:hypothetical protein [Candidatus Nanoarchaeia archaeon]